MEMLWDALSLPPVVLLFLSLDSITNFTLAVCAKGLKKKQKQKTESKIER